MHRELYRIYADGNVIVVQLALQGTHDGPLQLPFGVLALNGRRTAGMEGLVLAFFQLGEPFGHRMFHVAEANAP